MFGILNKKEDSTNGEDAVPHSPTTKVSKTHSFMDSLFSKIKITYSVGDIVDGKVIAIDRGEVYIALLNTTGIIYGREYFIVREILRNVHVGDTVSAKIIAPINENGYVELSLKEARTALIWSEAEKALGEGTIFEVTPQEANRGGLLIRWQGTSGFLPASQLSEKHYPRAVGGDKETILSELKKLVGIKLSVKLITVNPEDETLIFSEKRVNQQGVNEGTEASPSIAIDDIVEGVVTSIMDFGIFIKINNIHEGLVHISEISWGLIDDIQKTYSIGDHVRVKVVDIKNGKFSFSIKALTENPWEKVAKKYKKGDVVRAVVLRHSEYGALAAIEENVAGLIHISHFKNESELREKYKLGQAYEFVIITFESAEQKLSLIPKEIMERNERERKENGKVK